jgi:predicted transcriptional regulator
MDFKAATDVLIRTEPVTAADIAGRLGKDPHTIRRARMSGPNSRTAPEGWEAVVADLAEDHADKLEKRVGELRALATNLRERQR